MIKHIGIVTIINIGYKMALGAWSVNDKCGNAVIMAVYRRLVILSNVSFKGSRDPIRQVGLIWLVIDPS